MPITTSPDFGNVGRRISECRRGMECSLGAPAGGWRGSRASLWGWQNFCSERLMIWGSTSRQIWRQYRYPYRSIAVEFAMIKGGQDAKGRGDLDSRGNAKA
jgi:hypothetical protein